MKLFIAEKPSVAKAIANELGVTGKGDGYIECGADKITWCLGHLFELAGPDEYTSNDAPKSANGRKLWRVEDLPIIPSEWRLNRKDDTKKQLNVIGSLIKEATLVINAGDPDREGQCLVDDVILHFDWKRPVKRYWASSIDSVSVQRALNALANNETYFGWANAARARARADWLIGMNLSRAFTLRAKRGGSNAILAVGRVQTPTLALVVARDREIESFKSIPFHNVVATVKTESAISFNAKWNPNEDQLDAEGRLINTAVANAIVGKITGKAGTIKEFKQEPKKLNQPLGYSLSGLTLAASNKFGYSAEDVLNACQSLYETHKLTSYPRTDCCYLPESQHADAPNVLEAIKHVNPELAGVLDKCDQKIKSRTWDDKKITAHHGIIPTLHKGSKTSLSDKEGNIYKLILQSYLAQFYPAHEYLSSKAAIEIEGETFGATGKVITTNGWKDIYQSNDGDSDDEDSQTLPSLKNGDFVTCIQAVRKDLKTKPPNRYTEGTLGDAMENIHKYVTDPEHKKMLKEGDGIGTPATRASILTELKKKGFLEVKGKNVVSTLLGRSVIDDLPEVVRSPVLTALYERMLKGIEQGTATLNAFIETQEVFIREQVKNANDGVTSISIKKEVTPASIFPCPECAKPLRFIAKGANGPFWGCTGYPNCKVSLPDSKGKPGEKKKPEQTTFDCKKCGKQLMHRRKSGKDGYDFWGCSGFKDGCKTSYKNVNGSPEYPVA